MVCGILVHAFPINYLTPTPCSDDIAPPGTHVKSPGYSVVCPQCHITFSSPPYPHEALVLSPCGHTVCALCVEAYVVPHRVCTECYGDVEGWVGSVGMAGLSQRVCPDPRQVSVCAA